MWYNFTQEAKMAQYKTGRNTKEKIIEASKSLFYEKGYNNMIIINNITKTDQKVEMQNAN